MLATRQGLPLVRTLTSRRFYRQLHIWMGVLLSVQLLAWFASGLVMAWLPIDEVRGSHLRQPIKVDYAHAQQSPHDMLRQQRQIWALPANAALEFSLSQRGEIPLYRISAVATQQLAYVNAITGKQLAVLTHAELLAVLRPQYTGSNPIRQATLWQQQAPAEAAGLGLPLWQVDMADSDHTTFYLDAFSGQVVRVRTDMWRLFDFMWMLHIMDYKTREDFNHPLLILTSATALFFTVSGVMLLPGALRRQRR